MNLLEQKIKEVMEALRLDLNDPNLKDTPKRVAKMFTNELFVNIGRKAPEGITVFPNDKNYNQMIIDTKIEFNSTCAHHFLPFKGVAHIGYIPKNELVGISKLSRIVDFYSKKPQSQENLTEEITSFIENKLKPQGVMVVLEAEHFCKSIRGIKKPGSLMITSSIRGAFKKQETKNEFLELIK